MIASTYASPAFILLPDGEIHVERRAAHSRTLTATVIDVDGSLAPSVTQQTFDPLQLPQMQVYFDIGWNDPLSGVAMTERIPVGRFVIQTATPSEMGDGSTIPITGVSRSSAAISRNKWVKPYNVPSSISYDKAIAAALTDRTLRGWQQQYRFETSTFDTAFGMTFGGDSRSDPWADLQQLADADGKELTEDALGAFVLRTPPDPTRAVPVWAYDELPGSGKIPNTLKRTVDVTQAYNGVILRSSASWLTVPVLSTMWDTDPSSPTYYLGPFGQNAFETDSAMVSTQQQGDLAAAAKYLSVGGITEQIDVEGRPNPAHEEADVVTAASEITGVNDVALLEAFTLPFDPTRTMPVTIRRRRRR